jgi:outer membrane protein assembly factor BamD
MLQVALAGVLALGCARGGRPSASVTPVASGLSRAAVDSLWQRAMADFSQGKWDKALTLFQRTILEIPAGDSLAIEARFRVAECLFAQGNQLQAAREFRKVSDETPNARLAPEALLRAGDAYGDLWRRPELDPTYGQTALSTYTELVNRYPDSRAAARAKLRTTELEEAFATKQFKAAQYYYRLHAYDSAILYLKDIAASYPRAAITPSALLRLVQAYHALGYTEDVQETCGYIRQFHPTTPGLDVHCPLPRDSTASTSTR